ncbi:MAG: hypothetical protein IKR57_05235 [Bacilli bacterium]|nr:hypothetical protein [Bacilli bacterium]
MSDKFIDKKEKEEKKKILLKMMEEGKKISIEAKKNPAKYRRIKKLSNY